MQLTADLLQRATGCARGVALTWARPLGEACALFEIATPARLAAFLATVGHESAGLTRTVESFAYRADRLVAVWPSRFTPELARELAGRQDAIAEHVYGGRMGNRIPGDGWRFRGRGLIQVTGRANYEAVRDLLRERIPDTPDLLTHPEALAEPRWAALSAAAWWTDHDLNALADAGDFQRLTRRVNGGLNGWPDRLARYERAKRALA
jgi:putative chitinase